MCIEVQYAEIAKLCPVFTILGRTVFASIPEMTARPISAIGKKVANLDSESTVLFDAIDFLVHGI